METRLFFLMNLAASRGARACGGSRGWKAAAEEGGAAPHCPAGSPSLASTARAPLICRGVGDQHLHGAVTFTGAGDCSFILLLFSLPYTLLAVMTAILCLTHSSAAAPPRLLEATTNQASPRARSRARNFSIPKILTGNWGTMRQGLKPSECASTRKQPASSDPSVNIFQSAHTHCKMLISSWGSPFSVFFSSLGFWKSTGETITV